MRTRDNDESFDRNVKIVSQVNEFLSPSPFSMIKMEKCLFQILININHIIFKFGDN